MRIKLEYIQNEFKFINVYTVRNIRIIKQTKDVKFILYC